MENRKKGDVSLKPLATHKLNANTPSLVRNIALVMLSGGLWLRGHKVVAKRPKKQFGRGKRSRDAAQSSRTPAYPDSNAIETSTLKSRQVYTLLIPKC